MIIFLAKTETLFLIQGSQHYAHDKIHKTQALCYHIKQHYAPRDGVKIGFKNGNYRYEINH